MGSDFSGGKSGDGVSRQQGQQRGRQWRQKQRKLWGNNNQPKHGGSLWRQRRQRRQQGSCWLQRQGQIVAVAAMVIAQITLEGVRPALRGTEFATYSVFFDIFGVCRIYFHRKKNYLRQR
jgi:hypothetical protein